MGYFNQDGHLTDQAFEMLAQPPAKELPGPQQELELLEVSEHLAYCDSCVERYTSFLEPQDLMEPLEAVSPAVLQELRRKNVRVLFRQIGSMAVAACLALTFWFAGAFSVDFTVVERPDPMQGNRLVQILQQGSQEFAGAANRFASQFSSGLQSFVGSIDLFEGVSF